MGNNISSSSSNSTLMRDEDRRGQYLSPLLAHEDTEVGVDDPAPSIHEARNNNTDAQDGNALTMVDPVPVPVVNNPLGFELESGTKTVELAENKGDDSYHNLRSIWFFFQCTWPILLLAFNVTSKTLLLTPLMIIFISIVLYGKESRLKKFLWKDFVPILLWTVVFTRNYYYYGQ